MTSNFLITKQIIICTCVAIFEVLMNTNMKHICYFVFKSFVDNCQLCNFVGTEMDAEYDTVASKANPVRAYML